MNYHRLFLTETYEMYHLYDEQTLCYILIHDTKKKTPQEFLDLIDDSDGEKSANFFEVTIATLRELNEEETNLVNNFIEGLFLSKTDFDYQVIDTQINEEINTFMETQKELDSFLTSVYEIFGKKILFSLGSVNNLIQK